MDRWTMILGVFAMSATIGVARAETLPSVAAPLLPKATIGRIERMENLPSKYVTPRNIDIWIPDGYDVNVDARYNVLYMQDGQMLYDAEASWNKQSWHIDVAITKLVTEKKIPGTIVVGIWNNAKARHSEYYPQKFLPLIKEPARAKLIDEALQGTPRADNYLRFLVKELKPAIDAKFRTRPEREHTFVMGSSMGGMISIYAMNEYPNVFGGAAGLSTHWVGGYQANAALPLAAFNYLRDRLANPAEHRLYMDHGTTELDAIYRPYQAFIDEIVRDRGYTKDNFLSRVFEGEGHNERAWAARVEIPLEFLMGRR